MLLRSFDERRMNRMTKAKDSQLLKSLSNAANNTGEPVSPSAADAAK